LNPDYSRIFSDFLNKLGRLSESFSNRKIIASCAFPIDTTFHNINGAISLYEKAFYWEKSQNGSKFLALGELTSAKSSLNKKFGAFEKEFFSLKETFVSNFEEMGIPYVPLWVGGVKFNAGSPSDIWYDYNDSDWFVPKILFFNINNAIYAVCNFFYEKGISGADILNNFQKEVNFILNKNCPENNLIKISSRKGNKEADKKEWIGVIESALERIERNKFGKIVLSRKTELELQTVPDIRNLIARFNGKYSGCYIFAFRSGSSVFIGASPERLLKVKGTHFETEALAGSIRRGETNAEDAELASSLLNNEKEVLEHKFVSDFVVSSLSEFATSIEKPDAPAIKKLTNIQHLWTPITGELKEPNNLFKILENLAPTPAVCGLPKDAAMKAILELENYPRGLYSGVIGWLDSNITGEFAVGLRSALIQGKTVHAFAGGGIVKGSVPATEYDETELKLKPILSLFNDESK